MDLSALINLDVHVVVRVTPPLGVPTIYGPFPSRDAAFQWASEHCQKSNAYIGKVYHPDDVEKHTIVVPDGKHT